MMNSLDFQSWSAGPLSLGLGIWGLVISVIIIAALITLKGYALWYAAKRDEKIWFVFILIFNTLGILELVYMFFFVKKWHKLGSSDSSSSTPTSTPTPQV